MQTTQKINKDGSSYQRLLAIDPSLTASGWAVFCFSALRPTCAGVISPPGPRHDLSVRLTNLQDQVTTLLNELEFGTDDILVCEGPATLVRNPQSALKVEQVRGIFETSARSRGVLVPGRINPRTVHTELLGMYGRQLPRHEVKALARETATRLYPELLRAQRLAANGRKKNSVPQDVIDALLVGAVALAQIRLASTTRVPLHDVFSPIQNRRSSARRQRDL